nr:putative capsid [Picobirnavirus sp.]
MSRNRRRGNGKSKSEIKDTSKPTAVSESTTDKADVESKPEPRNDPEWYNRDPSLLRDAASIPFSVPFGQPLVLATRGQTFFTKNVTSYGMNIRENLATVIPGICTLKLRPSYGKQLTRLDPLNVAANALYTHVRYVNSGRKNYDPADLMLYALTFADVYSMVMWLQRLYGYAFLYSQKNWYIGKYMIEANGIPAEELKTNLANFRYWLNSFINKVSSYAVPADILFFKRRAFLYSNFYIENPYGNIRDQLYQCVPDGFGKFALDSTGAGSIVPYKLPANITTLQQLISYCEGIFENIDGDEDFGLMSGDILRAYGENILHLGDLGEDGGLLPVYDPYVLSQFKNAVVCHGLHRGDNTQTYTFNDKVCVFGDVCQGGDGVLYSLEKPDWTNSKGLSAVVAANQLINVENPEPNVGDVVEATRLHSHYYVATSTIGYVIGGGTEIVVDVIISMNPNDHRSYGEYYYNGYVPYRTVVAYNVFVESMFKYAPIDYLVVHNQDSTSIGGFEPAANLENVAIISAQQLARINEAAMLSLFYVPGVAKLV